ncbi:MAG: Fic family protein [Chlamydiales bacterium]|nr:Fic family protein [Chlamydiales bacterium]
MKMPQHPPSLRKIELAILSSAQKFHLTIKAGLEAQKAGEYKHWDTLRSYPPPAGLTREEWWFGIKMARQMNMKSVPLTDPNGAPFVYNVPDSVASELHQIDFDGGGTVGLPEPVINPSTRNQYLLRALVQEAITSSQLEGAATTREVAKQMIRSGRAPRDTSEQMILNNYLTMQEILQWKERPLDQNLIFEIHGKITDGTLTNPDAAGRFRNKNETVVVENAQTGDILHTPPDADTLSNRLQLMCDFANDTTSSHFIHPVIRAIILHFWLAYDHPFVDGNGRTARALFYWSMLRQGYWLCEFISISEILLQAPAKYMKAFLHTETDGNDMTYFIIHQADVLRKAIRSLHEYINQKVKETHEIEELIKGRSQLNMRQEQILLHALRHPRTSYSVEGHRNSHGIAYDTARNDLLGLAEKGLLEKGQKGKAYLFTAPNDLVLRIRSLA